MIFNVEEFEAYRKQYPELRYFQALCDFLKVARIEVVYREDESMEREDTYYWTDTKVDNSTFA